MPGLRLQELRLQGLCLAGAGTRLESWKDLPSVLPLGFP